MLRLVRPSSPVEARPVVVSVAHSTPNTFLSYQYTIEPLANGSSPTATLSTRVREANMTVDACVTGPSG